MSQSASRASVSSSAEREREHVTRQDVVPRIQSAPRQAHKKRARADPVTGVSLRSPPPRGARQADSLNRPDGQAALLPQSTFTSAAVSACSEWVGLRSEMCSHILPRGAPLHGAPAAPGQRRPASPLSHPHSANQRPPEASPNVGPRVAPGRPDIFAARPRSLREKCRAAPKPSPALRMSKHVSSGALVPSQKPRC